MERTHKYNIRIGRKATHNAISSKPWVTKAARNAETELEHLKLFITNEMLESVLHHTDTKIIETISKLPENFTNKNWLHHFTKEISMAELITYLPLLYHCDL